MIAIREWENIFLDTSIIINLLVSKLDGVTDETALFVNKLISYLNNTKSSKEAGSSNERHFFISSITLSEIWGASSDLKRTEEIIEAIGSDNVTFVSFDDDIGNFMASEYSKVLMKSKKDLNDLARNLSWPEHNLDHAREWILKDAMIIASHQDINTDVILTNDANTFIPICDQVGVANYALAEPEKFDQTEQHIMSYRP